MTATRLLVCKTSLILNVSRMSLLWRADDSSGYLRSAVSHRQNSPRLEFVCQKWIDTAGESACRKIINCTNRTGRRNIGKCLDGIKCKWENKVGTVINCIP
jgi:hypothetical protein